MEIPTIETNPAYVHSVFDDDTMTKSFSENAPDSIYKDGRDFPV